MSSLGFCHFSWPQSKQKKESEKLGNYQDLARDLKKLLNMNVFTLSLCTSRMWRKVNFWLKFNWLEFRVFLLLNWLPRLKSLFCPTIGRGRIVGFLPFPRGLMLCEMQTASFRIWAWVTLSIFPQQKPLHHQCFQKVAEHEDAEWYYS